MSNKILVVDDETEIADLIEVYLKNENYTVFKFYTAQEALPYRYVGVEAATEMYEKGLCLEEYLAERQAEQ